MPTDKIRKYVLPNIPYLFIGWACLKMGTAYRLAAGANFGEKLLGLMQTISVAFSDFSPGLNPADWLIGIVGAVAFRLLIYFKSKNAKKYRRDEEYGSSRWGCPKDIQPFADPKFENNVILTGTERLTMNTRPKNPANARNLNACIIGSSGSGKTRFWLTPQLLQAHSSYVCVDPKSSVLSQVGSFLQGRGYKIKVFNSIDFSKSMHYNPLAYIKNEADILKFVNALISNTKGEGKEGDPFWTKAETLLYCALLGYIIFEGAEEERNMNTLVDMISSMEVKEDDEDFLNAVDYMFKGLEQRKPDCFAVKQYKKYKLSSGVVCSKRLLNQAVEKSLRTHNLKSKKGAQAMRKNEKITALYERLSRDDFGKDDDQQRESNSISNQKAMLEEFAARQGFTNIVHFTDDGISGTCFDRPGFLAMMKEVEAGNVEYLCIKDMSRMGRDYLKVGQIMEILRQRGVRLIAINDGVDSARGDDDFTPFRNIMNEYYARDTSRKIRSTFQSKGKSGKHLTGTVIYGYLWNEARDQWLVDPEAADVVKRIFAMTIEGYGPYQIASKLKEEKILIPSAYLAQHGEGVNKNKTFKDVYGWGSSTICNILEKREYLGHTINFKTRKHFKDKKSHYVPEDEWTIFENTHEAIIDQQTFDLVQKIRGNVRRYPDGWGEAAPLTGLLYCADCGGKMYVHRTNNGKRISQYTCSQYSKVPVGKLCTTQHRINEDVVLSLVSEMLKAIAEYAKHDRAEFVRVVQEAQSSQQTAEVRKQRTRLATAKQRVSELEVLLCKIYEDNILGKLSDSRYATLDAQYEKEQSELTAEISALEKAVKSYEKHEKDANRFIALIDKYENFDKLTIAMLNEFIEKILVHERDRKGSIQTTQEVEIYFNFVGRFVPPAFGEAEL
ncbi:TPA: DUF4368 domain-containing protein, partial [Clostridioides difficile]|nr:DUF4368 domain-containing protein [Clostridioides difficile]HBH2222439.1 DUF4368 domain-containing protein [Clostridioides difficile]